MVFTTPARILGVNEKKGSLANGKDADIVIFDKDIRIETTMVKGELFITGIPLQ